MVTNSNDLCQILKLKNPYSNLGTTALSRRRYILFDEMCAIIKPYSGIKQFKSEIKLENLAKKHPDFNMLCTVIFNFDLNCAANNILQFLSEIQTTKRSYDPAFNKPIYKTERPPKPQVTELPIGYIVKKIERKAA